MSETQELEEAIALGFSAQDFLASPLGVYIAERSESQRMAALEQLADADPSDAKLIASLQHKIKVAESAAQWLADAVILGRQALARMQQMEFDD